MNAAMAFHPIDRNTDYLLPPSVSVEGCTREPTVEVWHGQSGWIEDPRQCQSAQCAVAWAHREDRSPTQGRSYEQEKAEYGAKIAARAAKEAETGKKPGGPEPKAPDPTSRAEEEVWF